MSGPARLRTVLVVTITLAVAAGLTAGATVSGPAATQVAAPDGTPFVVESTAPNAEVDYTFTVEGSVSKAAVGERGSEGPDRITDNGDGTVTVTGFAGNLYGDGFLIDGDIVAFEKTGGDSDARLELDGEDVTEELTGSPAPDGAQYGDAPIAVDDGQFVVESTSDDAEFDYAFTVDGSVSKTAVGERGSEGPDRITQNDGGTVTVSGFAGNLYGDGFVVDGEIVSFEKTGGEADFRLELNGADVTDQLTAGSVGADLREIDYGETKSSAIGPSDPPGSAIPNYYEPVTFTGEQGDVVTVDVLEAETSAYLRLVAPDGTVVAEQGYAGDQAPRITQYTLGQTGEYTIEAYGDDSDEVHDYRLALDRVGQSDDVDLRTIDYGETKSGAVGPSDEAGTEIPNYYEPVTFTADQGDVVTVDVVEAETSAYLRLVSPDGEVVAEQGYQGDQAPQITEQPLDQSGEYTIGVYGDDSDEVHDYRLALEQVDETDSTAPDDGGLTAENGQFVVESTSPDAEVDYTFTVEGSVSKAAVGERGSEEPDEITEHDDGTVTVSGFAGNLYGDGYVVDGEIVSFEKTGGDSDARLELDGEDVTEELTGSPAPDGAQYGDAPIAVDDGQFAVESTSPNAEFDYAFTVDGSVSKTAVGERGSEEPDQITENGDGTVTVRGFAGNRYGDGFVIDGEIVAFEKTGGESGFRLELNGEDVTDELAG